MSFSPQIRAVYEAFADVERPRTMRGCPCCTGPGDVCRLLDRPIPDLHGEDLERLAFKGITTLGSATDFHPFVPRLLELLAHDALDVPVEIVLGKLADSRPWRADQRRAVHVLLEEVLASSLAHDRDIDGWITGTALAHMGLTARLSAILDRPGVADALDAWVTDNGGATEPRDLTNAFWRHEAGEARVLVAWLALPATRAHFALPPLPQADGVLAAEPCLFTARVRSDGLVELDVEFEVHPGGMSSVAVVLDEWQNLTAATLHELAVEISGDPDSWRR